VKGGDYLETASTNYGVLKGIASAEYHENGILKRCILKQKNAISIPCGIFIPQYKDDGKRKKLMKSMTFYESGNIASMVLQDPLSVNTRLGSLPAEMITFYESGTVKRIFPVFGSISAFWTEDDEYNISPELQINLPFDVFKGKVINITLYENGELKSITLWPKDTILIKTHAGEIQTRIGFCLYPDGKIKSVEPYSALNVNTPIGKVLAFDPDALGIDGESNSLVFSENGSVKSLLTSMVKITVFCRDGKEIVHKPSFKRSYYFDDKLAVVPMKISFFDGCVCFSKRKSEKSDAEYKISECSFRIDDFVTKDCHNTCDECYC
jgi:antitoxin component YwqK of YwqJK toxin-antitoxin module